MRGGAICADMHAADKNKDRTETIFRNPIFRNLGIATPNAYLVDEQKWLRAV
jgi:hypothetical protein